MVFGLTFPTKNVEYFLEIGRPEFSFNARLACLGELPATFAGAQALGKPSIIHLKIDLESIAPMTTLSAIRERALSEKH